MLRRRSRVLPEIRTLDPAVDDQRIARLSSGVDFPWDTRRALELALLRTYGVPSSSRLLVGTGELVERVGKRIDDTALLIAAIGLDGYDGDLGRRAIRRMNRQHRRFDIPNEEYLYVLSTFVLEPVRWNERFGWRPLDPKEVEAGFRFWREVGRRMGLRDLPATREEMEARSRAFERERFAFDPANRVLAEASRDETLRRALGPLAPLGRPFVHALLDAPLRVALGLPDPPRRAVRAVEGALRLRAAVLRRLPARTRPVGLPRTPTWGAPPPIEAIGADGGERRRGDGSTGGPDGD